MRYEVFGPFPLSVTDGLTHLQALNQFWDERDSEETSKGLRYAVGVYVWTFKKGSRRVPWNVGLTNKQGFGTRFKQKEASFLRQLRDQPNTNIEVYLLALRTKGNRFRKPTRSKKISSNDWLETMLLGSALNLNPSLRNKAKLKNLKRAVVEGYLNDDERNRSEAARSFSAVFQAPSEKRK